MSVLHKRIKGGGLGDAVRYQLARLIPGNLEK